MSTRTIVTWVYEIEQLYEEDGYGYCSSKGRPQNLKQDIGTVIVLLDSKSSIPSSCWLIQLFQSAVVYNYLLFSDERRA
jgi:hypothetical protein